MRNRNMYHQKISLFGFLQDSQGRHGHFFQARLPFRASLSFPVHLNVTVSEDTEQVIHAVGIDARQLLVIPNHAVSQVSAGLIFYPVIDEIATVLPVASPRVYWIELARAHIRLHHLPAATHNHLLKGSIGINRVEIVARNNVFESLSIYTDVSPGFILHQLSGDIFAGGGALRHFRFAFPSAIRGVRIKRCWSCMSHSGIRHETCGSHIFFLANYGIVY